MNDQNLRRGLTPDEAREYGRMGGIRSGEVRRERKRIREALEIGLSQTYVDIDGREMSNAEAIAIKMIEAARSGDVRAAVFVRDSVGELPTQRIEQAEIAPEVYERVARFLEGE